MSEHTLPSQEPASHSYVVELARPEDAEGLFNVRTKTWLDTYPNEEAGITTEDLQTFLEGENGELIPEMIARFRKTIEASGENHTVFVAKEGEKAIAFAIPRIIEGQKLIGAIYLLPEAQDRGIGGKLLDKAIEWHGRDEDIFLHVASYNHDAIRFYRRNGFEETGRSVSDDVAQLPSGKIIPEIEMVLPATTST